MKIGIDIDDVLTNTRDLQIVYWKEYIHNNPNQDYTEELPNNINSFGIPYIQAFWDTYRESLSFTPTFKENAGKCLKMLHKDGFKLIIVTSRQKHKYQDLKSKLITQFKNNDIYFDDIITDAIDKGITIKENDIDILIDDSIHQIQSVIDNGKIGIHFSQENIFPYHTNNWLEIYDIVMQIKNME